ncbi:MAG: DNA-binding protein [Proteobacteria bacterium]|nr:DNA-binding protein [Pseudomonadota bacterium]
MTDEPNSSRPIRTTTARRGARRGLRRSKTLAVRVLTRDKIEEAQLILQAFEQFRPRSRGDCRNAPRPCPWVSCKYHLYLDIVPQSGSIKMNFPDLEVWEMTETCALDVADRGGITLEEVGTLLNLTRERIRQVERSGIDKLRAALGDEADDAIFSDEDEDEDLADEDEDEDAES